MDENSQTDCCHATSVVVVIFRDSLDNYIEYECAKTKRWFISSTFIIKRYVAWVISVSKSSLQNFFNALRMMNRYWIRMLRSSRYDKLLSRCDDLKLHSFQNDTAAINFVRLISDNSLVDTSEDDHAHVLEICILFRTYALKMIIKSF